MTAYHPLGSRGSKARDLAKDVKKFRLFSSSCQKFPVMSRWKRKRGGETRGGRGRERERGRRERRREGEREWREDSMEGERRDIKNLVRMVETNGQLQRDGDKIERER